MIGHLYQLAEHASATVRSLARGLLAGEDCDFALHDALIETGESPMLEVGKCYLVKTPTLYYLGRVKSATFAAIVMEQVSEVYETGPMDMCFGKNGKPENFDTYPPSITVTINTAAIIACPSWPHKLPGEKS